MPEVLRTKPTSRLARGAAPFWLILSKAALAIRVAQAVDMLVVNPSSDFQILAVVKLIRHGALIAGLTASSTGIGGIHIVSSTLAAVESQQRQRT